MLARTNPAASTFATPGYLPLPQAISLYAALDTVHDVIAGLRCQPRFNVGGGNGQDNQAGAELESLAEDIATRMVELIDLVRATKPPEPFYQLRRVEFLIKHGVGREDGITEVAADALRKVFQDQF